MYESGFHKYGVILTLFLKNGNMSAALFEVIAGSSQEAVKIAKERAEKNPEVESSMFIPGIPGSIDDYGPV